MKVPLRAQQFAPNLVPQHLAASSMKDIEIAMDNSRSIAMTFKNEYVPPLEQETSEFLKKARETLRTGHSKYDSWTIDRERDMVLFRRGGGNSMESKGEAYWSFIVADREHDVDTDQLKKSEVAPKEIAITYSVSFRGDPGQYTNTETIACIKEALQERGRMHLFDLEHYAHCYLTLIDATTGKEI